MMDTIGAESESRFQRWPFRFHEPWGDAPRLRNEYCALGAKQPDAFYATSSMLPRTK